MPRPSTLIAAALRPAVLAVVLTVAVPVPASARTECLDDAAADVDDLSTTDAVEQLDIGEADVLATCVDHQPERIRLQLRVARPTDPATDPTWDDFGAAAVWEIDVDGDDSSDFRVNFGKLDPEDGERLLARVFDRHDDDAVLCDAPAAFDGARYLVDVPRECVSSPGRVAVAALMFYDSRPGVATGYVDEVPAAPSFSAAVTTAADPVTVVTRLAGLSRVDTAIEVSRSAYTEPVGTVVLARADEFPDALAGAPLAAAVGGPLLLTATDQLLPAVEGELGRVLQPGGRVLLLGGPAALDDAVAEAVERLGYDAERVAAATRYGTAVEIAEAATGAPSTIYLADGNAFPDALIAGAAAAAEGGVVLLTRSDALTEETVAYLEAHGDVPRLAVGAVAAAAVPDEDFVAGRDATHTSLLLAEQRFADPRAVALASATNFPDGLAGGAHAGTLGIPLLLSWPDVPPDGLASYLDGLALDDAYLYGGSMALSAAVEEAVAAALG